MEKRDRTVLFFLFFTGIATVRPRLTFAYRASVGPQSGRPQRPQVPNKQRGDDDVVKIRDSNSRLWRRPGDWRSLFSFFCAYGIMHVGDRRGFFFGVWRPLAKERPALWRRRGKSAGVVQKTDKTIVV